MSTPTRPDPIEPATDGPGDRTEGDTPPRPLDDIPTSRPSDVTEGESSNSRPTQVPTAPGFAASFDTPTHHDALDGGGTSGEARGYDRARFRAYRFHAKGGLGVVYEAHDDELNRRVALKEIQEQHAFRESSRSRFTIEAEVTGRLEHPGIVPVYGLGRYPDGRPYYAMRFIQGESLDAAIRRCHDMGDEDAPERIRTFQNLLRRFLDVCNTIEYAHSRGVLHRDIKPANIMLGRYGETLVVDWGLARLREAGTEANPAADDPITPESLRSSTDTVAGQLIGTIRYMSPEQAAGRLDALGPASDVFSLGATLYMLLTGVHPMSEDDAESALAQLAEGRIPAPRDARPDVPAGLDAICRRAMAARPEDRYPGPSALAADLERWMADQPIEALPETLASRAARWARRHRQATLSAGIALLTITAVSVVFAVFFNVERDRADQAARQRQDALDKERQSRAEAEAGRKVQAELARKATTESQKVIQVVGLLVNTFRANDPIGLEGIGVRGGFESAKDLTAPVILERSAREVEAGLRDLPQVRATLLDTMGDIFRTMVRLDRAEPLLIEALEARRKELGPDHPDTATSLLHLGALRQDQTRYDEALSLFERALAIREATYTRQDLQTAEVLLRIGLLKTFTGDHDGATAAFREVIEVRSKFLGEQHREVALARLGLATVLIDQEKIVPALLETVRALNVLLSREDSARISKAIGSFQKGFGLARLRQTTLAERYLKEGLGEAKAALGPEHPYLALFYHELGSIQTDRGNNAGALENHRAAVTLMRKTVGLQHPRARNAVLNYGLCLVAAGQGDQAKALFAELIDRHSRVYGPEHPWIAECLYGLSQIHQALKEAAPQRQALERAVAIFAKPHRAATVSHPDALVSLAGLSPDKEKEPLYRRALAVTEAQKLEHAWVVRKAKHGLLRALLARGESGDEALALHADLLRRVENPVDYRLEDHRIAADLGIRLYRMRHDLPAARRFLALARDLLARSPKPPRLAPSQYLLQEAGIDHEEGKEAEALRAMGRGVEMLLALPDPPEAEVSGRLMNLATARLNGGDDAGYRLAAVELHRRFRTTGDRDLLANLIWTVSMSPRPAVPAPELEALLRRSGEGGPTGKMPRARALAYLRLGRPLKVFEQLDIQVRASAVNTYDVILAALARRSNGQEAVSRSLLERARREAAANRTLQWPWAADLSRLIDEGARRIEEAPLEIPGNVFGPDGPPSVPPG